jgi:UDP-2-acetamido-3-amino-2,3-dideoxy-glucuronate N-acetyltransferase
MAVHPTAVIEPNVLIGRNTAIWDHVHVRHSTRIGDDCVIGGKTYIAYGVHIGDRVKINSFVYICTEVTIERGVMISAGVVFTNDRFPRATTPDLRHLLPSDPDEKTLPTLVREGATIGAHATIGPGLTIGRFAMIGMGSVVTHDVPDHAVVRGNPARAFGYACTCGQTLTQIEFPYPATPELRCKSCNSRYATDGSTIKSLVAIS